MTDEKEILINNVVAKMNLDSRESLKLKNLLNIELYNYSLQQIEGTEIVKRDETLNETAMRMFLIAKNIQGCTAGTLQYYHLVILKFLESLNDKQVNEISTNDIRYYLAIKKERDKNSDTNVNNYRRVLNSFFGWLYAEEYIAKNPMVRIPKIKVEKRAKKPFKDVEIEKLRYGAQKNFRLAAILEVMLSTGCRISEVEGMNRTDIDNDEITVCGKGKKDRIVYLNAKARMTLQRYFEERQDDNPAMFVSMSRPHVRLSKSTMEAEIRNLGRACGVHDVHPHRFRRTAATMALNRGMPIEQVQIMLGHESIETTTIYAISAQEAVKASHKKYVI